MFLYPRDEIFTLTKPQRQEILAQVLGNDMFMGAFDAPDRAFIEQAVQDGIPLDHVQEAIVMVADYERSLLAFSGRLNIWPKFRGGVIGSANPPASPFLRELRQYDLLGARITMWDGIQVSKKLPAHKRAVISYRSEQLTIRETGSVYLKPGYYPDIEVSKQ